MANDRAHTLVLALVAAGATILGGTIGGAASYFATREANRAIVQRDERNDQLDARSAARLVDNELGVIQAILDSAKTQKLEGPSLMRELRRLPMTVWTANQQRLARTLRAHEWGSVSQAYTLVRLLPSGVGGGPDSVGDTPSGEAIDFVMKNVEWARRDLLAYQ